MFLDKLYEEDVDANEDKSKDPSEEKENDICLIGLDEDYRKNNKGQNLQPNDSSQMEDNIELEVLDKCGKKVDKTDKNFNVDFGTQMAAKLKVDIGYVMSENGEKSSVEQNFLSRYP